MPQLLEVAHLPEDDGVAEVEVGGGGVEADLDPERLAALSGGFQLRGELVLLDAASRHP